MEDGYHNVVRIPVNTSTELVVLYFQETEDDHATCCFSLRAQSLVDKTWHAGIAEAEQGMEDIDERIIDILIQEGTYKDHWLQIRRAIRRFGMENLSWEVCAA